MLAFSLCCGAPSHAADSWKLADLMAAMSAVPSTSLRFTEKKYVAILKEPLTLSGTLNYKRPDFIEKHVLSPHEERYTVAGVNVRVESKGKKRDLSLDAYPVIRAFVDSIRATLAGDGQTLQRFYRTELRGARDAWVLNLEPLDAQMAEQVSTIRLSGAGSTVDEVVVFEPGGDKSVMTIAPQ
ncbi:MAG: outer membrane lipoprotein carrier protein LolA [Pseudomonadota bacterium]|nr:outer membrane lipoprotein carrier protein LolA [Pseudomonadota bacterium]